VERGPPEALVFDDPMVAKLIRDGVCTRCRGVKLLCGLPKCPIIEKFYEPQRRIFPGVPGSVSTELIGDSPPGVFIGHYGWPKVMIGPLIPPEEGDTSLLDTPERWIGRPLDEIVGMRLSLIRGKHTVDARKPAEGGRIADQVQEMALCSESVESEAKFSKPPVGRFVDGEAQPVGPSAPILRLSLGTAKADQRIEKATGDTDLKAAPALVSLYDSGSMVSKLQRAFSAGLFGVKGDRRFVPTRWSITAVDDTIGRELVRRVKQEPLIDRCVVHEFRNLEDFFIVLFYPAAWRYESIEAWFPGTTWNPIGADWTMIGDFEYHRPRRAYAQMGGCYYAARLASCEELLRIKRQAGVLVLRESYPGHLMPVGVWNVRETVRAAMSQPAKEFESLRPALEHMFSRLVIPRGAWVRYSSLLKDMLYQRRLEDFERRVAAGRE
jgi:hypothetical protein